MSHFLKSQGLARAPVAAAAARPLMPARTWGAVSLVLLLSACGGGTDPEADATATADGLQAADSRAGTLAVQTPAVGTLRLASATASGQARYGNVCATSADGNLVLFTSYQDNVVAGDTNFANDLFLKNLSTGAVRRVSTTSSGGAMASESTCLGMSRDGQFVALQTLTGGSGAYQFPAVAAESAIFVKNLTTGALVRATPPRATVPTTQGFAFAGLSDDGMRLAYRAVATTTYLGGYQTVVNGPVRLFVSDLSNPAAVRQIDLQATARLTTDLGGDVDGSVLLSPDGRSVAFSTSADYPELGDTNNRFDLYLLNLDSLAVRRINTDVSGNAVSVSGVDPRYGVQGFMGQGRRVAFYIPSDSSAGPKGLFAKHLDTGVLQPLLATGNLTGINQTRSTLDVSLSDAGTAAVYVLRSGNSQNGSNIPKLRNLVTGQEQNVATTSTGSAVGTATTTTGALISADGSSVAFSNSGNNVLGTNRNGELRAYVKTVAAPAVAQR
jgi:hypothetical protein